MKVFIRNSITEIDKAIWENCHPGIFTFNYDFLNAIEKSNSADVEFRYVIISEQNSPVGIAVLSSFLLDLGLLAGNTALISHLKQIFPGLLNVRIACCGLPASFSQTPVYLKEGCDELKVISEISFILESFATETNSRLLAWKEFTKDISLLLSLGYHRFPSLPDCQVFCDADSIEEYTGRMRSNYRRKFYTDEKLASMNVEIWEEPFTIVHVEDFHNGYLQVMQRTPQKLEVYSKAFFYQLASSPQLQILRLTIRHENEVISALIAEDHLALNFLLVSKVKAHYELPLYNWLLQKIIRTGIASGKKLIKLGQTSYYSKQSVGGKLVPLHFYIKHTRNVFNLLLERMGPMLFPSAEITRLRIFSDQLNNPIFHRQISHN